MEKLHFSHTVRSIFAFVLLLLITCKVTAQPSLPMPDHVVVVIFENHAYQQIIGSSAAPRINELANGSSSALFTNSYAIEHPSQCNYLDLFSGANQGVTNDNLPSGPFVTDNLGRQLLNAGKSFATYSEDLPGAGYNGDYYGNYARKHNPAANWVGTGTNQVPASVNQPFTAFPSSDFSSLPTVSFVVPNQNNDMHNGSDPVRITTADTWFYNNMNGYAQWAKTHNSLLIVTFDEDNDVSGNHIATIFTGQMVQQGQYAETINHYTVLRTVEAMYGLPYAGHAASTIAVTDCWRISTGINDIGGGSGIKFAAFPNPAHETFTLTLDKRMNGEDAQLQLIDIQGRLVKEQKIASSRTIINIPYAAGAYFVKVKDGEKEYMQRLVIE
jgi:hypothetical protein